MNVPLCPSAGKMYIIISLSLLFTSLLTGVNVVNYREHGKDDPLFISGIIINIISLFAALYVIKLDMYDMCEIYSKIKCKNKNTAYVFDKYSGECGVVFKQNYGFLFVFLACSIYLITFGIMRYEDVKKDNKTEYYTNYTNVVIASIIFGAIGILYVFNEIVLSRIISFVL